MPALAVAQDARQHRDDAVDHPAEIDPHDPVPVGEGRQLGRPDHGNPGVVDQQVDLAEPRLDRIGGRRIGGAIGDIEFQRENVVATGQFGHGRVEMILPDIGNRHLHSRAEQRLGDTKADATGTARNECRLAWQILHVIPLPQSAPQFSRTRHIETIHQSVFVCKTDNVGP